MTGSSGSWHETSACTCTSIARILARSIIAARSGKHPGAGLLRLLDLRRPVALDRHVAPRLHRGPCTDQRQPALQAREFVDTDTRPVVSRDPRPQCHIGDGILAGDVLVGGELPVEHAEQARDLALVAVD